MVKERRNYEETCDESYRTYGRSSYRHYDRPQNSFMQRHHSRSASNTNYNNNYENRGQGREEFRNRHATTTTTSPPHWTYDNATSHRHVKEEEWREHTPVNEWAKQHPRQSSKHKHHLHKNKSPPSSSCEEETPPSSLERPLSQVKEYSERSRQLEEWYGKAHKRRRSLHSSEQYKEEYNNRRPKYLRKERRESADNHLTPPPPPPPYSEHIQQSNFRNINSHSSTNRFVYSEDKYHNNDYNKSYRIKDDRYDNTEERRYSPLPTHRSNNTHKRYSPYSARNEENRYAKEELHDRHRQEELLNDSDYKSYNRELGYSHNRRFGYGQMYISRSATPSFSSSHNSRTSLSVDRDLWNKESKSHEYENQNSWKDYERTNSNNKYRQNNKTIGNDYRYTDKINFDKHYHDDDETKRHYGESKHKRNEKRSTPHQSRDKYDNKRTYVKDKEKQQSIALLKCADVLPELSPISPISEESTSLVPTPIHSSVHLHEESDMKTTRVNKSEDVKIKEDLQQQLKLTSNECEQEKRYNDNKDNLCPTRANVNTDANNNNNTSNTNITTSVEQEERKNSSGGNNKSEIAVQVKKRREEIEKEYLSWLYSTTSKSSSINETHSLYSETKAQNKELNIVKKENVEEEEEKQKEIYSTQTTSPLPRLHSVELTDWRAIKPTEPFYAETNLTALRLAPRLSQLSSFEFSLIKEKQQEIQMEKRNDEVKDEEHVVNDEEVQNKPVNSDVNNAAADDNNKNEDKCQFVHADSYYTEAIACFNHHFSYGKVHPKPPWYLCANLHDNCEHPYYVDWLDTIELPSLSEQLIQARIKRTILASANKPKKDEENS